MRRWPARPGRMSRREFLAAAAGMGLAAGCANRAAFPDTRLLVDTAEKRERYLSGLLEEICALGPRPVGSRAYDRASRIVHREMRRCLPEVAFDEFSFERWRLSADPEFLLGGEPLETCPSHGSGGTGPEGVDGVLRPYPGHEKLPLAITAPDDETPLAFVSISEYGRAVPLPYYSFDFEPGCPPVFNIGRQDAPRLERAMIERTPVRAVSVVEFIPGETSANVVGRLPGQSRDEIVWLAHLDTVYNSPGANDNLASLIAMLMIAHAFSGARNEMGLTFVATSGEEYGKLGAEHYAAARRARRDLASVRFLINLDSITWGPDLKLHTADDGLMRMLSQIHGSRGLPGRPLWSGRDGFMLDARPFRDDAIRALYVNSTGYDLTHLWHRPEDLPATVPVDCVETWYQLFRDLTARMMTL